MLPECADQGNGGVGGRMWSCLTRLWSVKALGMAVLCEQGPTHAHGLLCGCLCTVAATAKQAARDQM